MGFLPNGLIIEWYDQIYKYSFINKPTNTNLWECSQKYEIKFHKSLNRHYIVGLFVYQTKLFLFNQGLMTQWDLSTMTFEMQYNLVEYVIRYDSYSIVINKNQTLLALHDKRGDDKKFDLYSMETGVHISRYG
jgi:hypothetical protein